MSSIRLNHSKRMVCLQHIREIVKEKVFASPLAAEAEQLENTLKEYFEGLESIYLPRTDLAILQKYDLVNEKYYLTIKKHNKTGELSIVSESTTFGKHSYISFHMSVHIPTNCSEEYLRFMNDHMNPLLVEEFYNVAYAIKCEIDGVVAAYRKILEGCYTHKQYLEKCDGVDIFNLENVLLKGDDDVEIVSEKPDHVKTAKAFAENFIEEQEI